MPFKKFASFLILPIVSADVITGIPDSAPPGYEQWISDIVLPAKNISGDGSWAAATAMARAFVSKLTLEEKINVTTGSGSFDRCVGNTGTIPRFGWKGLCLEDSPLGVRFADFVSAFPAGINAATTWDKSLIYARGKAMGQEHRGKGVNVQLGPMMNLGRVAAGGRNWEGFGADTYLAGVASAETIRGIQSTGVMANAKHLIGNEQESFRGGSQAPQTESSNIDDRTMHELYLWPFAESINAGVATIMCSYNKVNQTQTCQNSKVLNGIIKEELDFQGPIISDWNALITGVQPALAGCDMDMPGFQVYGLGNQDGSNITFVDGWWRANLIEAVRNGSVPEWRINDMVTRTLSAWFKLGQDSGYPDVNFDVTQETYSSDGRLINEHVNVQDSHYKLIREIGAASTVLLKNTKEALPLKLNRLKRIGIFGSDAGPNPNGPNSCDSSACDQGTLAMGWGSGTANFPYLVDPSAAINTYVQSNKPTTVVGSVLNDSNYDAVTTVAKYADACLVFANADSGEGSDRNNLLLSHGVDALITNTAAVCPNTIVILHTVGPVLVEAWIDNPNITAVLAAGLPGQETGNAIVDVLFGAVNPSGRLPYTIAKQRDDYPADVLYNSSETTPQVTYSEGLNIDYRHFDANNIAPRFEFGFGLSYTTFSYSSLSVHSAKTQRTTTAVAASSAVSSATSPVLSTVNSAVTMSSRPLLSLTLVSYTSSAPSPTAVSSTASLASTSGASPADSSAISSGSSSASASASRSVSAPISVNATYTFSTPLAISSPAQTHPGGPAFLYHDVYEISFTITNTGGVDGHEVPQLYLSFPDSAGEPPRVLRGFERVFVPAGATVNVDLTLRTKDVSVWDTAKQRWVVPEGTFIVSVGSSSRNLHLNTEFSP